PNPSLTKTPRKPRTPRRSRTRATFRLGRSQQAVPAQPCSVPMRWRQRLARGGGLLHPLLLSLGVRGMWPIGSVRSVVGRSGPPRPRSLVPEVGLVPVVGLGGCVVVVAVARVRVVVCRGGHRPGLVVCLLQI